ncbi:MAG TPA: nuclear transport factor 2 family protein [Chloroflexota bacterium]
MDPHAMDRLIEIHLAAEKAGDTAGAVSVYTEDVEHDVVGAPHGPLHGPAAAEQFYKQLTSDTRTEEMRPTHRYYGDDFCVIEHIWTGTVPGSFFGIPGHGRRISHRLVHVWEFRDGLISRENVWLDGASVVAQLTAPSEEQHNGRLHRFTQMYAKLPARDVNRARAFFADKLGLVPFGEREGHLYYELGGAYFLVFPSSGAPSGTHDQLGLIVENLEAEVARLQSLGIVFEDYPAPPGARMQDGIMHRGHMKAAWFKDSEGNLISIAEFTTGSPFQHPSISSPATAGHSTETGG